MKHPIVSLPLLFVVVSLIAMASTGRAMAQQYPPRIDWLELGTPHFRVIFPREIEADAQRVAATLEQIYAPVSKSMGRLPARIPIVLGNRSTVSNGFVSLGPRRSVWQSTPFFPGAQSLLGVGEWYDLLAVHEFRHVAQFATINQGASRLARIGLGENGLAVSAALAAPGWFWEGDAVGLETVLTRAGRGRMPAFDMHLRAMLKEGISYSYPKSRFRSFRDFVPGQYPYGYALTTHARRHYGQDVWADVIGKSGSWSFVPLMFPLAVKQRTGRGLHRLHREAMAELDLLWREQRDGLEYTGVVRRNTEPKRQWTNYAHPHYSSDSSIVAVQSGLREDADLVELTAGQRQRKLGAVDAAMYFGGFDANASFAVWTQSRTNPRYTSLGYSVLMRRDLATGDTRALTRQTRYFKPAISPSSEGEAPRVAVIEMTRDRRVAIAVLNASTGALAFKIDAPENQFISEVAWTRDGRSILAVAQNESGKSILEFGLQSYSWNQLLPPTDENVWGIVDGGDYILYVSDYSGIDNIYALHRSGAVFQVTSRPLGAYYPALSPTGDRLAYSDYTVDGFDVVETRVDLTQWRLLASVEKRPTNYFEPMLAQEAPIVLEPELYPPATSFPTRKYRRFRDAIRFHSWQPTYDGREAGLALQSNNLLNTLSAQVGAVYDRREGTLLAVTTATYSAAWPILTMTALHGGRTSSYRDHLSREVSYSWLETGARGRIDLPLLFRRGNHAIAISMGLTGGWFKIEDRDVVPFLDQGNGHFTPVGVSLSFTRGYAAAYSDFNSPRSIRIVLAAQSATSRSDYKSEKLYGSINLIRRGLGKQHRFRLSGEAEVERPDNYRYSSLLRFSRGYSSRYADNAIRGTFEYAVPAAYPDLAIGNWLYIPRIIATGFYDYTWLDQAGLDQAGPGGSGSTFSASGTFSSVGAELMAEFYVLSLPVPVRAGVRWLYRIEPADYVVEPVLFSIQF